MRLRRFIFFMLTVLLVLTSDMVVIAQTQGPATAKELNVVREQVTIFGTKGQRITQNLILHTQKQAINNIKILPSDLIRTDKQAFFPAERMTVNISSSPTDDPKQKEMQSVITPTNPQTVSLTFDLQDAKSGEFDGVLFVNYAGGQDWIPVSLTVKDRMFWPLLILFVGVGLGVLVSWYRASGKPRDELIVRIDTLRKRMEADKSLADVFRKRLDAEIIDVEAAMQAAQWDDARAQMVESEKIWTQWRRGRDDWRSQFDYLENKLKPRLQGLDQKAVIVQHAQRELENIERNPANLESPETLRQELQEVADSINRFDRLSADLERLNDLLGSLTSAPDAEEWRSKILALRNQLRQLKPTDEPAYQQMEVSLAEAVKALQDRIPRSREVTEKGIPTESDVRSLLESLPETFRPGLLSEPSHAESRLRWFAYASYAIAILLLVWGGFDKLYIARTDFGVTPSSDYFSLLIWGFGAEATRAAIIEMIQTRSASGS